MEIINGPTETVQIDAVQPHPRNARQGDVGAIHESIASNGFYGAVVAQRSTGYILAGNHRWMAACAAGASEIPVTWVDVDDDRALRILLADNRTNDIASYDDNALADLLTELAQTPLGLDGTGFDGDALDELLADLGREDTTQSADPAPQIDRAAELQEVWGTERGQIWAIPSKTVPGKSHRLMCGDSSSAEDVARLMGGNSLAMIFTSPPYAVGLKYNSYTDSIENLRSLLTALATLWRDHVSDGGYCVTNFNDIVAAREMLGTDEVCEYPMALEYWPVFRAAGWTLHTRRAWAKPHARIAAPWTASSNRAASDWEHLWTWKKPGVGLNDRRDPSYLGVWDTSKGEGVAVGKGDHPAGFPAILPQWAIGVYSNRSDSVGEPFCGTGTTMVAAENEHRICYGMEIDPGYVAITLQRMTDMGLSPHRVTRDEDDG